MARPDFSKKGELIQFLGLDRYATNQRVLLTELRPHLRELFDVVNKRYKSAIRNGSLRDGPGNKIGDGAIKTGALLNALRYTAPKSHRDSSGVQVAWAIAVDNPADDPEHFERADNGWRNARRPNLSALVDWLNTKFGWKIPATRSATAFQEWRQSGLRVTLPSGAQISAASAVWLFYRKVRRRRYKGLKLSRTIESAAEKALEKMAPQLQETFLR